MDLGKMITAITAIVVMIVLVVTVAVPIIDDVVNQKEIKIVPGQGEGPIDLMSSDVEFISGPTNYIVVDGQQYTLVENMSIDVLADTFVISHENQAFYFEGESYICNGADGNELTIIDGTLYYDDKSFQSSWCYAYVETYPASTQTVIVNETGTIGPLEYGGGDVRFIAYYPGGIRQYAVYSIDETGNVVHELGRNELDTIHVTVAPTEGNYSITIEYSDRYMDVGFVIIDREYVVVASQDDPTFELINVIPLIMFIGIVIAAVGLFIRLRSR